MQTENKKLDYDEVITGWLGFFLLELQDISWNLGVLYNGTLELLGLMPNAKKFLSLPSISSGNIFNGWKRK